MCYTGIIYKAGSGQKVSISSSLPINQFSFGGRDEKKKKMWNYLSRIAAGGGFGCRRRHTQDFFYHFLFPSNSSNFFRLKLYRRRRRGDTWFRAEPADLHKKWLRDFWLSSQSLKYLLKDPACLSEELSSQQLENWLYEQSSFVLSLILLQHLEPATPHPSCQ